MEELKSHIVNVLGSYKCTKPYDEIRQIPLWSNMNLIGLLEPVTYHYKLISPEYISLLSRWRRENPIGFATDFEVTDIRTEFWLDNILLKRDDRILFIIKSINREAIGHIGLSSFNFQELSCEIDNVVRGVKEGYKGIMTKAMDTLIIWCKNNLLIDNIFLRVLSDNFHAIDFYRKNGFKTQFDIPLYKTHLKDEIKWIEAKSYENQKPDRYYTVMKFTI